MIELVGGVGKGDRSVADPQATDDKEFHWSISSLYSLQKCGQLWRFEYGDLRRENTRGDGRPEFAFGKAVHKSIERIHQEGEWEPHQWMRTWDSIWHEEALTIAWENWPGRYRNSDKLGPEILSLYTSNQDNREAKILHAETKFTGELAGLPIVGIVDQVRWTDKGALLIDFKTSKDPLDELALRTNPQLTLYAYLWKYRYGHWPRVAQYHLRSDVLYESERDENDLRPVANMLREAEERVRKDLLTRQLGFQCNTCVFRGPCLGGMLSGKAQ